MPSAQRVILSSMGGDATPVDEVMRRIEAASDVTLLDAGSSKSLLVQGSGPDIEKIAREVSGWKTSPLSRIEKPDVRPKVEKSAE